MRWCRTIDSDSSDSLARGGEPADTPELETQPQYLIVRRCPSTHPPQAVQNDAAQRTCSSSSSACVCAACALRPADRPALRAVIVERYRVGVFAGRCHRENSWARASNVGNACFDKDCVSLREHLGCVPRFYIVVAGRVVLLLCRGDLSSAQSVSAAAMPGRCGASWHGSSRNYYACKQRAYQPPYVRITSAFCEVFFSV